MSEFKGLKVITLEFEPYISVAKQCGLSDFRVAKSDIRYYLFNINDGGHFPVCEIRPISTNLIKDAEALKGLFSNRAYAFGSEINKELAYKI
jgi:hypothetical protein